VPELTTQLLLDGLLVFIILLFVPFGIRRGVAREAVVSAGVLLGALVAGAWAAPGAAWLSQVFGVEPETGGFVAALAALLAGTFLLGYGAGGVVAGGRPGVSGRLAGALLAALNGALFLSYLLQFIETYLRPGDGLDDGIVVNVLLRRFDELVLAAGAAMLLCTIVGWITRAARRERVVPEAALAPARTRPVRVADEADAGKYEPTGVPTSPRASPVVYETAPLPAEPADPWRRPTPTNGHAAVPTEAAWRDGATAVGGSAPGGAWTSWGQTGDPARRFAAGGGGDPASDRRQCPTCGAVAGPHDVYCPQCGKSM
jgi:uncharacterized membrane protein required for colicin V production